MYTYTYMYADVRTYVVRQILLSTKTGIFVNVSNPRSVLYAVQHQRQQFSQPN